MKFRDAMPGVLVLALRLALLPPKEGHSNPIWLASYTASPRECTASFR